MYGQVRVRELEYKNVFQVRVPKQLKFMNARFESARAERELIVGANATSKDYMT